MVQLPVDSVSSTNQHQGVSHDQYHTSIEQEYLDESNRIDDLNSLSCTATQLSLLAWTAMLERSNKRLEKFSYSSSVRKLKENFTSCMSLSNLCFIN